MRTIKIPATETTPHRIALYDDELNNFGYIDIGGHLTLLGEDSSLNGYEVLEIGIISSNFDLFFNNIKTEL